LTVSHGSGDGIPSQPSGVHSWSWAAFGVSLLLESPSTDKNPSYVHLNPASNTFEVYNREDGLLKIMPSKWVPAAIEQERRTGYPLSVVTDLNGDGRNEIVTRMVFDRDTEPDFRLIRVFSPDLKILHEVTIGRAVTFNGVEYHGAMPVTHNMAGAFGGGETKEILAAGTNGRSPCVLSRFDNECRLLGEFWHFGNLPVVREVSLPPDTGRLILLAGVNDVHDARWESFPVIIVIDPRRISGITESVGTRGFGMAPSDAEVMYIRLPRDAVSRALNHKGLVTYMSPLSYRDGNRYSFRYQSDDAEPFADYDFIFSTDFRFVTVKTSDRTRQVYAALVNAGKLTGSLDDAFLANLAHGVRYWNGSAWREECVRVAKRYTPPDSARMNRYMKSTPR